MPEEDTAQYRCAVLCVINNYRETVEGTNGTGHGEGIGNLEEKNAFLNLKAWDTKHLYYKEIVEFSTDYY